MVKILWIAPLLNHYKISFLECLNRDAEIDLFVFSGSPNQRMGHSQIAYDGFASLTVSSEKEKFGFSPTTAVNLLRLLKKKCFDCVLMPVEKKHLPLILFLAAFKRVFGYKLVAYNHPLIGHSAPPSTLQTLYAGTIFGLYDRVIFYTRESMQRAVAHDIVTADHAGYANNTLNTDNIWKHYSFSVNHHTPKRLLFIGRLVPYRELNLLLKYFNNLKVVLPEIEIVVIGDGPEAYKIQKAAAKDQQIIWRGAIINEMQIAKEMQRVHAVFMPGHSGLSIVHAFAYGKPYITSSVYPNHPPEIDYLQDGVNGLLLSGNVKKDVLRIANLLKDPVDYKHMCEMAYAKAKELAIENWCDQMKRALRD